jgi:hypothetical protein
MLVLQEEVHIKEGPQATILVKEGVEVGLVDSKVTQLEVEVEVTSLKDLPLLPELGVAALDLLALVALGKFNSLINLQF